MQKKTIVSNNLKKVEGNSKQTWKLINEIRGKQKTKIKPSFIIDGCVVEERRIIANSFNKYFTSLHQSLVNMTVICKFLPYQILQAISKIL